MGLDQALYAKLKTGENVEIRYFRKHPDLHGAIAEMWCSDTGEEPGAFNCIDYKLTKEQLKTLYTKAANDNLPPTTGFFFGQSLPEDKKPTLDALTEALDHIKQGNQVFYTSWW